MIGLVRVALLSSLLLLAARPGRSADDKMPTSSYFPTDVGTTWQYRVGENHYTVKVTAHEKIGALMCAKLQMIVNKKPVTSEHIAVTKAALVRAAFDGKAITPPIPFLALPPKMADNWKSWKIESKLNGQLFKGEFKAAEQKDLKVLGTTYPSAVSVSGKSLDINGTRMDLTYYFVEKIGMVRQEIVMLGQKIVIDLEKFEAGKKPE